MDSNKKKDTDSALDVLSCVVVVFMWIIVGFMIGTAIGILFFMIFAMFTLWASGGDYSTAIFYSIIGFIIGIAVVTLVIFLSPQSTGGKK